MNYQFILDIEVTDPEALMVAAAAHPDSADIKLMRDGDINLGACLAILLDPGTLPGCEIHSHQVEGCL